MAEIGKNYRPKLGRSAVLQRTQKGGGVNLIDWVAYGEYVLALQQFRYEYNEDKKSAAFFADCLVISSQNDEYPPGTKASLHFHTGRPGTTNDPKRADRDDEEVARFVMAVWRQDPRRPAEGFDVDTARQQLEDKGRIEGDALKFVFERKPGNRKEYPKYEADGSLAVDAEGRMLKEVRVFPRDAFRAFKG